MGLATTLRGHGVDAILDKWDLKPGQDKYVFMESMVVDQDVGRVLVVCDRKYQEKANARAGGVGTESQIISQELYGKVKQTKFIPVVCEYDDEGQPCLPIFMKGLIYIDLSTDERYGEGLDELLRLIYDQPFHQKPQLGSPPAFVQNPGVSFVKELPAALRAIRDGKPNRKGLEAQFIKGFVAQLLALYAQPEGDDYDEGVYQAILATKGLRDQFAEYVETVAAFSNDDPSQLAPFFKLMEEVGGCFGPPKQAGTFYPGWADFFGFLGLEAMLLQTAALLRHQSWNSLRRVLSATYLVRSNAAELKPRTFTAFDASLVALDDHRNRRLQLNRAYLSADMLKERCGAETLSFGELSQADVFLTLKSLVIAGAEPADSWASYWAPRTAVYTHYGYTHPIFMRAADEEVRRGIHRALGVASGAELATRVENANKRLGGFNRLTGNRSFSDFSLVHAVNIEELAK